MKQKKTITGCFVLFLAFVFILTSSPRVAAQAGKLYGIVSQNPNAGYLISIDTATGDATLIGDTGLTMPCTLDYNQNTGILLASKCFGYPPQIYSIDYETGEATLQMSNPIANRELAYRFVDNVLYVVDDAIDTTTLYKLDPGTGALIEMVGIINKGPVNGLAVRPSDRLLFGAGYANMLSENWLFTIDTASGPPPRETNVGQTDRSLTGLAFHPDGTLYATDSTDLLTLTVNPSTGTVTVTEIGPFGTELSVFYPAALKGIESLIPRAHREGVRGNIVTNWMKGSPYENTDFGFTYAAALTWDADISISREDFKARYAKLTFGCGDPAVCDIFEKLSLWLPYAEPVQNHMPDRLDRFNLSGLRFREKWQKYTTPDTEPQTLAYLTSARARAAGTRKILKQSAPKCTRGRRQLELFDMSAECIAAKADFALMLHKGRLLEHGGDIPAIQKWLTDRPRISVAWQKAKQKHHAVMLKTSFAPAIEFLNDLMFEPAEYTFAQQMAGRLAAKLRPQ